MQPISTNIAFSELTLNSSVNQSILESNVSPSASYSLILFGMICERICIGWFFWDSEEKSPKTFSNFLPLQLFLLLSTTQIQCNLQWMCASSFFCHLVAKLYWMFVGSYPLYTWYQHAFGGKKYKFKATSSSLFLLRFPLQPCLCPYCGRWMCTGGSTACPQWDSSGSSAGMPRWNSSGWLRPSSAAGASLVTTASTWMSTPPICPSAIKRRPTRIKWVSFPSRVPFLNRISLEVKATNYASKRRSQCFLPVSKC